jgi:CHAT domain-containing protein
VTSNNRHLSEKQLHDALDAQLMKLDDSSSAERIAAARLHLNSCEECRNALQRLEMAAARLLTLRPEERTAMQAGCPEERDVRQLAVQGQLDVRVEELMNHIANCDACAVKFREAVEDLAIPLTAEEQREVEGLQSSRPDWQTQLAHRLAKTHAASPIQIHKSRLVDSKRALLKWLLPAAALIFVVFSSVPLYRSIKKPSLDQLLLTAYSDSRPVEMRIAGAEYPKFGAYRGPNDSGEESPALLEARKQIQTDLARRGNDPTWLAGRARTELLAHKFDAAIQDGQAALAISPGLRVARLDLASAYAERGVKDRPWDTAQAIEILTKLHEEQPEDRVVVFNLALALERAGLLHKAVEQWHKYLVLDPSGGWADEAKSKMEADEGKIKPLSRDLTLMAPREIAQHGPGLEDAIDQNVEDYLRQATVQWLPQGFGGLPNGGSAEARAALHTLAEVLQRRHHDTWLLTLLSTADGREFPLAVNALARAISANNVGDYEAGRRSAQLAQVHFSESRNRAGELRARLEEIYSLRLSHNAAQCDSLSAPMQSLLSSTGYEWIRIQTALERQECLSMRGDMGRALAMSTENVSDSKALHYPQLYLRSLFFAADTEASLGNLRSAWRHTHDGLSASWSSGNSAMRTYSFVTELDLLADQSRRIVFDEAALSESLEVLGADPDSLMRAMANHRLARLELELGHSDAARQYFESASKLFSAAPRTTVTRNHRIEAEIGLARTEIERKEFSGAAERLSELQGEVRAISNRYLQIDFLQALAEANLGLGRTTVADAALCSALDFAEHALGTLHSDGDRLQWDHAAGRAYRSYVETKLRQHDPVGALERWEWYKASAIRSTQGHNEPRKAQVSEGACSRRDLRAVQDELPSLKGRTVVSFAMLPSGLGAWAYDERGVRFHWITENRQEIEGLIERFAWLCTQRNSDQRAIGSIGRALYKQLLQPFDEYLKGERLLILEPDGVLWSTPFSALIRDDGEYLGGFASLSEAPGIYYRKLVRAPQLIARTDLTLAVLEDDEERVRDLELPALPTARTEVAALSRAFTNTIVLRNREATQVALAGSLQRAEVFHFAGHAIQTAEGAALVIASPTGSIDSWTILPAASIAFMEFPKLHLVVLSACGTDLGEEEEGLLDSGNLVRAFMTKGVPEAVATKWSVESASTEEIMRSFYGHLVDDGSPSKALQLALIDLRSRESTSHPHFWAAFTSFGWT